jgi:CIC family chloride channel protein
MRLLDAGRLLAAAVVCGVVVGLIVSLFGWSLTAGEHGYERLLGVENTSAVSVSYMLRHAWIVLIPAAGGLLVGLFTQFVAPSIRGYGVPEVMARVEARDTNIPARHGVSMFLGSLVTISSHGSAGPEGPSAAIGAALSAGIAHRLRLTDEHRRLLVACGAAAGLAALFNASLVGAFFALEVLLKEVNPKKTALVLTAAVAGKFAAVHGAIAEHVFHTAVLPMPTHSLVLFAFGLGVLTAPVGVGFIWLFHRTGNYFKGLSLQLWLKPALGGLIIGVIGLFLPQVLGEGQQTIQQLLVSGYSSAGLLLLLSFMKMAATSITLGSGGMGGIFLPSIFVGTALGSAYGLLLHQWIPAISPELFATIGTGTIIAAAINAPLTAIMIGLQLTGAFEILPVLVAGVASSTLLARYLQPKSIYTVALRARSG